MPYVWAFNLIIRGTKTVKGYLFLSFKVVICEKQIKTSLALAYVLYGYLGSLNFLSIMIPIIQLYSNY